MPMVPGYGAWIGVATPSVAPTSRNKPQLATIRKLATALGVDAADIAWPGDPLGLGDESEGGQ